MNMTSMLIAEIQIPAIAIPRPDNWPLLWLI
jgi:hypothetical protein